MGKTKGLYKEEFPVGSLVQIACRPSLENFLKSWKLHNPLEPKQLQYAGQVAEVETIAFYHGGDELYRLKAVPGIWHEQCLKAVAAGVPNESKHDRVKRVMTLKRVAGIAFVMAALMPVAYLLWLWSQVYTISLSINGAGCDSSNPDRARGPVPSG